MSVVSSRGREGSDAYYSSNPLDAELRIPRGAHVVGGRFLVEEEIGRGGTAVVYRALDRANADTEVALKVVMARAVGSVTELRYTNEDRLGRCMASHPHVVSPLEVGRLDGPQGFENRMFLATQYVCGDSLDVLVLRSRSGLDTSVAVTVALGIAHALVGLHEQSIVHRDIKPGNIMIEHGGRASLIDFGLAYSTGESGVSRSADLTVDGVAPGTLLYMPLEQALHGPVEPGFDIYAFGVVLFEMLVGHAPHHRVSDDELLRRKRIAVSKTHSVAKLRPGLPGDLVQLIEDCLALDSKQRPTASSVVATLSQVVSSSTPAKVVAVGARPAGDVTRTDIVRKSIPLPFVEQEIALAKDAPSVATQPALPVLDTFAYTRLDVPVLAAPETGRRSLRIAGLVVASLVVVMLIVFVVAWQRDRDPTLTTVASGSMHSNDLDAGTTSVPVEVLDGPAEGTSGASSGEPQTLVEPLRQDLGARLDVGSQDVVEPTAPIRRIDTPRKRKRKQIKPAAQDVSCEQRRSAAEAAQAHGKWDRVLKQTKYKSCWSSTADVARLRARAFMGQGRYKACLLETQGSRDSRVVALRKTCMSETFGQGSGAKND